MAKCLGCGTELAANARFCSLCGKDAAAQKAAQAEGVGNAETMLQTYGPKLHAATQ